MARERLGELVLDDAVIPIELDLPSGRLDMRAGDEVAFITIRLRGSVLSLIHTEVPTALQGKGVGKALVRAALDYARAHRMTVKPFCPFVARYIRRHPEFQDLVDPTSTSSETAADGS